MPRLPRVHFKDAVYFVTLDGPQHEPVFRDPADYSKYQELLGKYKNEFQFKLFAYALLPSRLYLLMETSDQYPISHVMQKLTPQYTKYYNSRYERKGPLFPKRFRSIIVEKASYLTRLTRFVHLIPLDAGLVRDFKEYPYTSYAVFTHESGTGSGFAIDLKNEVQEILQDFSSGMSGNSYERFVSAADSHELEFLNKKLYRGAFLGSEEFVREVKERMQEQMKNDAVTEFSHGAVAAAVPYFMTKRLWALSGALMLAIMVSGYSLYWNLNARFSSLQANITAGSTSSPLSRTIAAPRVVSIPQDTAEPSISLAQLTPQVPLMAGQAAAPVSYGSVKDVVLFKPDLNDTTWDLQLMPASELGDETPIKDKIRFTGRSFESYYFKSRGFSSTRYTAIIQNNGTITWETIQRNPEGETVSWRGDWQGDRMEGMLSYQPAETSPADAGAGPRDFSFVSVRRPGNG